MTEQQERNMGSDTRRAQAAPRVLYLVNAKATTSIPLEVASHFRKEALQVTIAAYYQGSDYPASSFGAEVIDLGGRGRFDLKAVKRLYRLIRDVRPEVIHVHHTVSAFWGSLFGRICGVPVLVKSEHTDHRHFRRDQNLLNVVTLALADAVLCNSDQTRESFLPWEKLLAARKSLTVHNGVNVDDVLRPRVEVERFRQALGIKPGTFVIGSVGRFVEAKNFGLLIRAMAEVVPAAPRVHLLLVGGGPQYDQIVQEARQLGLQDHVTFTGAVDRSHVYELLHVMDVFVVTSLWEGFCNAAVEAMIAAKPVVCSEIKTMREVVGDVGIYFDPRDPAALARTLLAFMQRPADERSRQGQACQERALGNFTIERTAERYSEQYRRLLSRKDRPVRAEPV